MIVRIRGILESVETNTAVIATDGGAFAHAVLISAYDAAALAGSSASIGAELELHTIQLFEASGQGGHLSPKLLGFRSARDRRFFELLCTVRGIGPRKALRVMAIAPPEIASAISRRDTKLLATLPEIGKRTAESIAAELHDRVAPFVLPGAQAEASAAVDDPAAAAASAAIERAVSALINLGENRADAERLVKLAAGQTDASGATADELLAAAFAVRSAPRG